jgi:hypothetical protein
MISYLKEIHGNQTAINTTDCILEKIDEYRRNWLLHLQKMPQNRIPLKSYLYSPHGKRTIGRPKKRLREQL